MAGAARRDDGRQLISFRVVCSETTCGEQLRVVGSAPELGAWSPEESQIVLSTSAEDYPVWKSDWVPLPAVDRPCDYKLVVCGSDGGARRWEPGPDRRLPSRGALKAAGPAVAIREAFGRPGPAELVAEATAAAGAEPTRAAGSQQRPRIAAGGEVAPGDAEAVASSTGRPPGCGRHMISFAVTCGATQPGQRIKVVGSHQALGEWAAAASQAELSTNPSDFPIWHLDWLAIPVEEEEFSFEYKYVICDDAGSCLWESGPNRRVCVSSTMGKCVTVEDVYGRPELQVQVAAFEEVQEARDRPLQATPSASSLASRRGRPLTRSATECLVSEGADALERGRPIGPATLRRRATVGCLAELPEGLLPTRRALGIDYAGNGEELVREAGCLDLRGDPEEPRSPPAGKRRGRSPSTATAVTDASEITACGADTSDGSSNDSSDRRSSNDSSDRAAEEEASLAPAGGEGVTPPVAAREDTLLPLTLDDEEDEYAVLARLEDEYALGRKIGEGAFGQVYACVRRGDGDEFAAKVVHVDRLSALSLAQLLGDPASGWEGEARLHASLPRHPCIVGLHGCFHGLQTVSMVMDVCCGGDLFDAIAEAKRSSREAGSCLAFSEEASRNVLGQVLSAAAACHAHGVVHRDIKAENVLLQRPLREMPLEFGEASVKLCDFGLAAHCLPEDGAVLQNPVGSPDYVAPEVARMEAHGCAVDVWSCGVLLFACLRGRLPYNGKTDQEVLRAIRSGAPTFDEAGWSLIDDGARGCVEHLLEHCPEQRPRAAAALEHAWFVPNTLAGG